MLRNILLVTIFAMIFLSVPSFALTKVWNATYLTNANNASNWNDGVVPTTSDDIIFNATGTGSCNWDLVITTGNFNMNTGYSGTMNQTSNVTIGGITTLVAGTLNGSITSYWTQVGNFTKTGGTVNNYLLNIIANGNVNFSSNSNLLAKYVIINTGYTLTLLNTSVGNFTSRNGTIINTDAVLNYFILPTSFLFDSTLPDFLRIGVAVFFNILLLLTMLEFIRGQA